MTTEVDGVLEQYYKRFFPFRQLYQWLNHSPVPSPDMSNRELAFVLPSDAYVRYLSYSTAEALKKDVLRLRPTRFEVGPVYSANPRDRKMYSALTFKPLSKELVFDIDLTDYDPVRTCCQGKDICIKCWQFITVAIDVLEAAFRDDFGFKHILWVYSGRRGAHAWVCDEHARKLDDHQRRAIVSYVRVIGKGSQGREVRLHRPLHPHLARSLDILKEKFEPNILVDQDPWRTSEGAEYLLELLGRNQLTTALRERWGDQERSSTQRWRDIDEEARKMPKSFNTTALLESKQDVIFEYMYPRIDAEVSKRLNHLLKAPFCVHPATGKVCVPIDASQALQFDPMTVPTTNELLEHLDEEVTAGQDSESSALKPYVQLFSKFVQALNKNTKRAADDLDF